MKIEAIEQEPEQKWTTAKPYPLGTRLRSIFSSGDIFVRSDIPIGTKGAVFNQDSGHALIGTVQEWAPIETPEPEWKPLSAFAARDRLRRNGSSLHFVKATSGRAWCMEWADYIELAHPDASEWALDTREWRITG